MSRFSRKYGYDPRISKEGILEDAPEWLRVAYINGILSDWTYVDQDERYQNSENRPLGIKGLYEEFCVLIRQETEDNYWDSWVCWDFLSDLVKSCEWYEFYDIVEYVGRKLKEEEDNYVFEVDWGRRFGFETYRRRVNELFAEDRIGWRLDENSELRREIPAVLSRKMEAAEKSLEDEFEPARENFKKAQRYIYEYPSDPENSIKEIVSAVESVGKTLYTNTSTLGDVVKVIRKSDDIPTLLVSMIEKFYAFASSEPAVRHGSSKPSKILIEDAEFCLLVGVALIRYLIAKREVH